LIGHDPWGDIQGILTSVLREGVNVE